MDRDKFNELSLKGKIHWIIDYYGWTILFSVIAILIVFNLVKSIVYPEPVKDIVVMIYADGILQEDGDRYAEDILAMTGKEADVYVNNPSDIYGRQAFAARVGADQIDIIITPEGEMGLLKDNGYVVSSGVIEGTDVYLGVTKRARQGDYFLDVLTYFETEIAKELKNDQG